MGLPLVHVDKDGSFRWLILLLTALSSGLLTGTIFGFVPLQNVMVLEGVYAEACASGEPTPCDAQYLKLNMMFTASSVVFNLVALPTGFILDMAGPRLTMVLACGICVLANLLFAFSSTAFPAWLGAYCVMGVGGVMVYISQFYLGSFFPGHEGFVFAVINGFMNASNAFYMVCEPMYNAGFSLKTQFLIFATIPLALGVAALLLYPHPEGDETAATDPPARRPSQISQLHGSMEPLDTAASSSWQQGYNIRDEPLLRKMFSVDALLFCLFLGFTSLSQIFYMSTLDQQLGKMAGGDPATYTHMFFLVLPFVSLIGVPIAGFILDKMGTVVSMIITRLCFLVLNGVLLIPNLQAQAVGFVAYTFANLMLWASVPAAMERIFGQEHFGAMYGLVMTFTGLINLLNYLLLRVTLGTFEGNFDPCNYMFLATGAVLFILPVWLYFKDRAWNRTHQMINESTLDFDKADNID